MLKLVVLFVVLAAVAAEPGALFATPLAYSSVLAPATTSISQHSSSVVHPSPLYYSAYPALSHFIKKRSAPLALAGGYFAQPAYIARGPLVTYQTPLLRAPIYSPALSYPAPAHFIKKRSVALALPTPYIAPTTYAATAPLLTTAYTTPIVSATPVISHAPIAYPHLIKKRSAPLVASTFLAPTSYSTQSRVDVTHSAPLLNTYTYPLVYSNPILPHVF